MTYPIFPSLPGQAIGIKRTPVWRTNIQPALSGKEVPISYMSYPLYQWSVDFAVLRSYGLFAELAQMVGFINSLQGMAGYFLFQDPEDNTVTAQTFGIGNGTQNLFYLNRTYGGYNEPVTQMGAVTFYLNGAVVTQGTGAGQCQTSPQTGSVYFNTAPAAGAVLSWSGTFYFLCRMLQDNPSFSQEFINAWSSKGIQFQSKKL